MKFLNSVTAAIAMGVIVLTTSIAIWAAYINVVVKPNSLEYLDGFLFLYFAVVIIPIIIFILTIVFRVFYKKLNVPFVLFSGVFSLWVFQFLFQFLMLFRPFYPMDYFYILPIILFVLGYLFIKRKNTWLYINGFTMGTLFGWLSSYSAVILWRKITNTLTSFFWFDEIQKLLLLVAIFLGAWIGIYIEKKRNID